MLYLIKIILFYDLFYVEFEFEFYDLFYVEFEFYDLFYFLFYDLFYFLVNYPI